MAHDEDDNENSEQDQKAIDSMADAMLGGLGGKKKEPVNRYGQASRGFDDWSDEELFGGGYGTGYSPYNRNRSPSSLSTTDRSTRNLVSVNSHTYGARSESRQVERDMRPVAEKFAKLEQDDLDEISPNLATKKISDKLMDYLEFECRLTFTRASNSIDFRDAVRNHFAGPFKELMKQVMAEDMMRTMERIIPKEIPKLPDAPADDEGEGE